MNSRFETLPLEPSNSGMIDRLVAGSLPDAERRTLLLRLETEPDGWRQCALGFLEAQAWREAFAPLVPAAAPAAAQPNLRADVPTLKPSRIAMRWAAITASLLAAFALGWTLKHFEPSEMPREFARETPPVVAEPSEVAPSGAIAVAEVKRTAPERSASSLYVEAVVKTLQNNGYSAERQDTLVNMTFQDGKERKIPAQEIRLHYTGGRTY
jgi:hypothetical protein